MGDLANVKNTLPAEMQDVFDADSLAGDLYDGVQGGFAVISIRGSRFRIAKAGEETVMLNEKDEPIGSLECVLVKASRNVSKLYYAKSFEEGDDAAPDCWSIDGITPDQGATTPQSKKCATCPQNVWVARSPRQVKRPRHVVTIVASLSSLWVTSRTNNTMVP